ncbi:hypothetical protein D3C80_1245880 [compost metagenome]
MCSKNFYRHSTLWSFQKCYSVTNRIFWCVIGQLTNWICSGFSNTFYFRIVFIVNQNPSISYFVYENFKLLYIIFIGWKNIDMIPGNPRNQGNIRLIQMKFRSSVNWRRQIFVAFQYHKIIFLGKMHHGIETFQLCTNHIIHFDIMIMHDMKYHRSNCCFSM